MLNSIYFLVLQIPYGTQNPDANKPIDFTSPFDVIVFVILPILMIILYIYWRRSKKKGGQ